MKKLWLAVSLLLVPAAFTQTLPPDQGGGLPQVLQRRW
jgi:hypothetical protein